MNAYVFESGTQLETRRAGAREREMEKDGGQGTLDASKVDDGNEVSSP